MKGLVSYILICVYLTTSVGFKVEVCTKDDALAFKVKTKETHCNSKHNENEKRCASTQRKECSCHTLVYVLDTAQEIVSHLKMDVPVIVLGKAFLSSFGNHHLFYTLNVLAYYQDDRVRGPDGGITAITPLRL